MRRVTALLVAVLVVVATVPAGVAAAGSQATSTQTSTPTAETTETENATTDANETTPTDDSSSDSADENGSEGIAPGEQFAGVLAVQQAEIDGELESRSFGHRVSEAATNDSKARVVADQLNESRERLDTLRERRSELRAAREAGNISQGRYRAQAARLTAEIRSLQRLLNQSSDAARELPEDAKRANGIDSEEVERLRTEARNLSGDEVSDVAKRVAGPGVGNGLSDETARGNGNAGAPGRSGERGPPSGDDSDRGPNVGDPPGPNATDGNVTDENETAGSPGKSGGAPGHERGAENDTAAGDGFGPNTDAVPGRENETADDGQNGVDDGTSGPNGPAEPDYSPSGGGDE